MEPTTLTSQPDVQASAPTVHVSLSRVGVTGVEKVIRIAGSDGNAQLFSARLECFVDLGPRQKGAHMSRFEEVVNERSEEHTSELQSRRDLVCRLLLEKKKKKLFRYRIVEQKPFCRNQHHIKNILNIPWIL